MNKFTNFFLKIIVFLALATQFSQLYAQDSDDDPNSNLPIQPDWDGERRWNMYQSGDKIFTLNLGGLVPLGFMGKDGGIKNNVIFGGTMSLVYGYFITNKIFVGGELQGSFNATIGQHFIFMVPMLVKAGYHFVMRRFEFPLAIGIGAAGQTYNAYNLISPMVKIQAAAYYRFNNDWSFGLNAAGWFVPQWTREPDKDVTGYFLEIGVSAQYHF